MRIIIDGRVAQYPGTGVATYGEKFIQALGKNAPNHEYIIIFETQREVKKSILPPKSKIILTSASFTNYYYRDIWEQFILPLILMKTKGDIFHSLDYPLPLFSPIPTVITIYDTIPFSDYDNRSRLSLSRVKLLMRLSARSASKIITISKNSCEDIYRIFNVPKNKIAVIYPGSGNEWNIQTDKYASQDKNYIINIGSYQKRKNRGKIVNAYKIIAEKFPNIKLVFTGELTPISQNLIHQIKNSNLENRVILTGNLVENEIKKYLEKSIMMVFPSLYEGFGFPILEAMKNRIPVITSNIPVFKEIAGNAAIFVDPQKELEIADAMDLLLSNEAIRNKKIKLGIENVYNYSWDECANLTITAYEDIVNKR